MLQNYNIFFEPARGNVQSTSFLVQKCTFFNKMFVRACACKKKLVSLHDFVLFEQISHKKTQLANK